MAEEKEASRTPSSFSSLEDHVSIQQGTQACFENFKVCDVVFECLYECLHPVVCDLNLGVDNHTFFLLLLAWTKKFLARSAPLLWIANFNFAQLNARITCCAIYPQISLVLFLIRGRG